MQKPLLLTCWKNPDLAQLETVLRRWFYEVQSLRKPEQLVVALRKNAAHLLIVDAETASYIESASLSEGDRLPITNLPILILNGEKRVGSHLRTPAWQSLDLPLDLGMLHGRLQEVLKSYPRKHLRISVRLPGVLFRRQGCSFADILSLGTGGAFVKTGCRNLSHDETMEVVIPLLGMKKELELKSRVIYEVTPSPENNYQQGVGIAFIAPDDEAVQVLRQYITQSLLEDDAPHASVITPAGSLILPGISVTARAKTTPCQLFQHI